MRVDEEVVEAEAVDEVMEAVVEEADVAALAQHARDLARADGGGDEVDVAAHHGDGAGAVLEHRADFVGRVLDGAVAPEVVVEGAVHLLLVQAEEDVDAGRLDVGVDDADAVAPPGDRHRQVGGDVGLARPAPERVHRYGPRHRLPPTRVSGSCDGAARHRDDRTAQAGGVVSGAGPAGGAAGGGSDRGARPRSRIVRALLWMSWK